MRRRRIFTITKSTGSGPRSGVEAQSHAIHPSHRIAVEEDGGRPADGFRILGTLYLFGVIVIPWPRTATNFQFAVSSLPARRRAKLRTGGWWSRDPGQDWFPPRSLQSILS